MATPARHAQPFTAAADLRSDRTYTYLQVAEFLQISERSVQRLVTAGKLRACVFGNTARISSQALQEFMDRYECRLRRLNPR